jgi:hypothetical protein
MNLLVIDRVLQINGHCEFGQKLPIFSIRQTSMFTGPPDRIWVEPEVLQWQHQSKIRSGLSLFMTFSLLALYSGEN